MPATSDILTQETSRKSPIVGFHDEQGYVDLVQHIMETGNKRGDRTGTGVVSVFGAQSRYSLRGVYDISFLLVVFFPVVLDEKCHILSQQHCSVLK